MEARFEPLVPLLMEEQVRSLEQFAAAHGKDPAALRKLNPGFRDGRVVAGVPRLVLSTAPASPPRALVASLPPAEMLASNDGDATTLADATASAAAAAPGTTVEVAPAPAMLPVSLPPASGSAPEPPAASDAPPNPDPPEPVHEVRAGDTLSSIAKYYQLPIEQILRANKLERDARLRPGQRLRLVP
jgi:membrane-bound lytic murein transglycosylase D